MAGHIHGNYTESTETTENSIFVKQTLIGKNRNVERELLKVLNEQLTGTKYSKMDQLNLWKTTFKNFYLVHS